MPYSWYRPLPPATDHPRRGSLAGAEHRLLMLAAVGGACLCWWDPESSRLFPPCPFHWATGLYCPGCGSLRALHALWHGQIQTAWRMNPMMVICIPPIAALILKPAVGSRTWVAWVAFAVLMIYGIFRNLPAWPFCWLAPHG